MDDNWKYEIIEEEDNTEDAKKPKEVSSGDLYDRISTNLTRLLDALNWNQNKMASALGIGPAAFSYYKTGTRLMPLNVLVDLCKLEILQKKGISFTISDFLREDFDPAAAMKAKQDAVINTAVTDNALSKGFCGTYFCYFFDQSKPVHAEDSKLSRKLRFGVMTIFNSIDGVTAIQKNNVYAKFYKDTEWDSVQDLKQRLDDAMQKDHKNLDARNKAIHSVLKKETDLYHGELTFSGERAFIQLSCNTFFDSALIALYASSKKVGKNYSGGCGCVTSVAHGEERMPTAQKIILSRFELKCSNEAIADYLSMASAPITPSAEAVCLCDFCKKVYSPDSPLFDALSDDDKQTLIQKRMTKLIHNYIDKNICCVSSVSKDEDKKVYELIKSSNPNQ